MNFSSDDDLTLIEPGKYEVVIDSITKKTYKDDTKTGISVCFKIRTDVEQRFGGLKVWEFFNEDAASTSDNWWPNLKKLSKLVRTVVEPTGTDDNGKPTWSMPSADKAIVELTESNLVIYIDKEFDDTKGADRNVVRYMSYEKSTAVPKQADTPKVEVPTGGKVVTNLDLDVNDLPF